MIPMLRYLPLILLAFVPACATATHSVGRDFDLTHIERVTEGETTSTNLIAWFGEPFSRTITGKGTQVWLYQYTVSNATVGAFAFHSEVRSNVKTKSATFTLVDGIVETFTATL